MEHSRQPYSLTTKVNIKLICEEVIKRFSMVITNVSFAEFVKTTKKLYNFDEHINLHFSLQSSKMIPFTNETQWRLALQHHCNSNDRIMKIRGISYLHELM